MSRLFGRIGREKEKAKRKSRITVGNPEGFQHNIHIDRRDANLDHGENVTLYRKALHPFRKTRKSTFAQRSQATRDSFYVSIPNVAEEFTAEFNDTFNSTMYNSGENDIRKTRSVNFLDQCDGFNIAELPPEDARSVGFSRGWSASADNLDTSGYQNDALLDAADNGNAVARTLDDSVNMSAPVPPPRIQSIELSERSVFSKSQSEYCVARESTSSSMEKHRRLSKSSENVESGSVFEVESRTPPPKFNPPSLVLSCDEPDAKSESVTSGSSLESPNLESDGECDRQAKLNALLAKFAAKPKRKNRIPLSNGSSLCNSIESLDELSNKSRQATPSKLVMKSTENLSKACDLAEVPPPLASHFSAPEPTAPAKPPKVLNSAPKPTPRIPRPAVPLEKDFKIPPIPKPRNHLDTSQISRSNAFDMEDDDDVITDL